MKELSFCRKTEVFLFLPVYLLLSRDAAGCKKVFKGLPPCSLLAMFGEI